MITVGVDPIKYWEYTLRQLDYIAKSVGHRETMRWARTRNIEFALYNTSINAMNGKQNFRKLRKPSDLYSLSIDKKEEPVTGKEAIKLLDSITKK